MHVALNRSPARSLQRLDCRQTIRQDGWRRRQVPGCEPPRPVPPRLQGEHHLAPRGQEDHRGRPSRRLHPHLIHVPGPGISRGTGQAQGGGHRRGAGVLRRQRGGDVRVGGRSEDRGLQHLIPRRSQLRAHLRSRDDAHQPGPRRQARPQPVQAIRHVLRRRRDQGHPGV